ncbi:MAG: ribosome silencing factor [Candidatus Cloacimonetes bacterium]|nr:ribosome silencing factor [Candidatus Cloacimonadota bacterium]
MLENALVKAAAEWLADKKAERIKIYHIEKNSGYTDYAIVCEASADLHVRAVANHVIDNVKLLGMPLLSKEGIEFAHWSLIDLGEVIIHVFLPQTREYYHIDELFSRLSSDPAETVFSDPGHDS